jgi:Protein of unknown function (DUF998)
MPFRTSLAGVVALTAGCVLMVLLHVLPPTDEISPLRRTLSQYALTSNKWLFDGAVLLVALGSALGFVAVVRASGVAYYAAPVLLGVLWIASLLTIVAFTKTNWVTGPSIGGVIHRYASVVGFVSAPIAVILLAHKVFPDRPLWRAAARGFGVVSLAWFGVIIVGFVRMLAGYGPWWQFVPIGLVQRVMALAAIAAIGTLALGLALKPRDAMPRGDLLSAA